MAAVATAIDWKVLHDAGWQGAAHPQAICTSTPATPTALFVALKSCPDQVPALLAAGADAHQANAEGTNALIFAIEYTPGCVPALLAASACPNQVDEGGDSALLAAAAFAPWCMADLLHAGALVDIHNKQGWTALHIALENEVDDDHLVTLLDAGASLTAVNHRGFAPLHTACWHHHPSWRLLVQRGADINARTGENDTPLLLALQSHSGYMTRKLRTPRVTRQDLLDAMTALCQGMLDAGADPCLVGADGVTVLHQAAEHRPELLPRLLAGPARKFLERKNVDRMTPLMVAAVHDAQVGRMLLAEGADAATVNRKKETALMLAAAHQPDLVDDLLGAGAAVHAQDRAQRTALHHAAMANHPEVAQALLDAGCNPHVRQKEGTSRATARELAEHWASHATASVLLRWEERRVLEDTIGTGETSGGTGRKRL